MFSKFRFGERKVSEVEAADKLAEDEKNSSGGDERCQVPPIDDGTERLTTSQPIADAVDPAPTEAVDQPGDDEFADRAAVGSEQEAAAYSAVETNVEGGQSVPPTDQAPGSWLGGGEREEVQREEVTLSDLPSPERSEPAAVHSTPQRSGSVSKSSSSSAKRKRPG